MTTITTNDFVFTSQDSKPARVILSVPHDGLWPHNLTGHFIPRSEGVFQADRYVTTTANDILIHCRQRNVPVDLVRFLMPRVYVDANRPAPGMLTKEPYEETAFEDEQVRQYYDRYYEVLGECIQRGIATYGTNNVIMLDLHGFTRGRRSDQVTDFDIILGTKHRQTIKHGDPDALLGSHLH